MQRDQEWNKAARTLGCCATNGFSGSLAHRVVVHSVYSEEYVQRTPHRTFSRCVRHTWLHVGLKGLKICLCASKSHFITGHVFVENCFDTASSCSLIIHFTPLTGMKLNPCATLLCCVPSGHLAGPNSNTSEVWLLGHSRGECCLCVTD